MGIKHTQSLQKDFCDFSTIFFFFDKVDFTSQKRSSQLNASAGRHSKCCLKLMTIGDCWADTELQASLNIRYSVFLSLMVRLFYCDWLCHINWTAKCMHVHLPLLWIPNQCECVEMHLIYIRFIRICLGLLAYFCRKRSQNFPYRHWCSLQSSSFLWGTHVF